MKPFAYVSKDGVLFKELPPGSWLDLKPLYTSEEIDTLHRLVKEQQDKIDELNNPIFKAISLAFNELTDEEILLLSKQVPLDADTHDLLLFARAIIKKVGGG